MSTAVLYTENLKAQGWALVDLYPLENGEAYVFDYVGKHDGL